jgi:two-component system, chemotaxis family, CheB/CheR fusion protein
VQPVGVGTGSEFLVELPVLDGRVATARSIVAPRILPPRRILVVDDNCDAAETLGALLAALGARVSVVHTGRAALDNLESFNPDTVLLDIGMPEMDGYEVSRRIRAMPNRRDVLLIALSGWGQEHDYRRSRVAGFDCHFVKPPDIDRLCDVLTTGWPGQPIPRTSGTSIATK